MFAWTLNNLIIIKFFDKILCPNGKKSAITLKPDYARYNMFTLNYN